ncbi:MAG TPA: hypothetical protein ENJ42_01640, partial [Hellea balneolensis]|nr:hypothetical protein [Hellea balneolensis]
QVFGLAVVAGLSVIPGAISANLIARKIGKRNTLLLAIAVLGIFHTAPIGLRLLGVLPPNGAPVLYFLVAGFLFISQTFAVVSTIIAQSMMADVADEYASVSGRHQQAGLFAAITFAQKTTFGIGVFFAGLVLDLVHFPVKTASTDIPNEVIRRMGAAEAISVIVLCICTFLAWSGYDLNKNRHEKIQNMLSNR